MIPAALDAAFEALNRRLDPASAAPVAVALSGGSDSLALLQIARGWADAVQRPLVALTVDHGLHPDSAAWTQAAGDAARRLGTPWRALPWTGPKPAAGLPAAARHARHAMLAEAARALGARVLLFGHTADDVAESELIRAETPIHGRLAEWSPSPAWPQGRGVFLLRPLLSLGRADLRAWLAAEGVAWLDDPANVDMRFARSRVRKALAGSSATLPLLLPSSSSGSYRGSDVPLAGRLRAAGVLGAAGLDPRDKPEDDGRERGERGEATEVLAAHGVLSLDLALLLRAERPADALAKVLLCVSGRTKPPAGAALNRLLTRLAEGGAFTATLSGARARVEAGRVRFTRELGRSPPPPVPFTRGLAEVFDERFELVAQARGWRVGPLAGHAAALPKREREALQRAPPDARPSLPVLLGPDGEVRLPQPFGAGPATTDCLVAERLASAWGLIGCEGDLERAEERRYGRGAARALILS